MKLSGLFGLLGVVLLGLACGGGGGNRPIGTPLAKQSATLEPTKAALATVFERLSWTPPPTLPPLIAAPDVRPCASSDVVAALAGRNGAPATAFVDIGLGNRSATACQLSRMPELRGADNEGHPLPIDVDVCPNDPGRKSCVFPFPVLLLPGLGDITQQHRLKSGQAVFVLSLLSPAACPSPPPLDVPDERLLLPDGGGEVKVRDLSFSACRGHVDIISFTPTTAPD